jgi:hypothetical protein
VTIVRAFSVAMALATLGIPYETVACRDSSNMEILVSPFAPRKLPPPPFVLLKVRLTRGSTTTLILDAADRKLVGRTIKLPPKLNGGSCFQWGKDEGIGYIAGKIVRVHRTRVDFLPRHFTDAEVPFFG